MPSIRSRQRQRQQTQGQGTGGTSPLGSGGHEPHPDFVSDRVFSPPLMGICRGRIVKVQERGNSKGMSATWLITNETGDPEIVSLREVRFFDGNALAPTVEQMEQALGDLHFKDVA